MAHASRTSTFDTPMPRHGLLSTSNLYCQFLYARRVPWVGWGDREAEDAVYVDDTAWGLEEQPRRLNRREWAPDDLSAAHLVDRASHRTWHDQIIGDRRDLFRLSPCARQQRKLASHGATLGFLVQRHLERETLNGAESE